jgi:hypothetical protein
MTNSTRDAIAAGATVFTFTMVLFVFFILLSL